jgi:hypothetical protein
MHAEFGNQILNDFSRDLHWVASNEANAIASAVGTN